MPPEKLFYSDTMKPKIVCLDGATVFPAGAPKWDAMRGLGDFTYYERTAAGDIAARCEGAEIILTNKVPLNAATIASLTSLRYIGVLATGYNIVDTAAAAKAGVVVTNIPSYSTSSVAQHVFSLLLAAVSSAERYAADVREGGWCACPDFSYRLNDWNELAGKTFGIVGFGHIGTAVAAIAAAMGMKVAVNTSKPQAALPAGYEKMELDRLFERADVLSLHCPLFPETREMVDARRLSLMKPGAILINTARGPLVDEQAVADALRDGCLGAYCCDVLCNEPPIPQCSLLSAPRCFITPHIAWASTEARLRLMDIATGNVRAFLAGEPANVVN